MWNTGFFGNSGGSDGGELLRQIRRLLLPEKVEIIVLGYHGLPAFEFQLLPCISGDLPATLRCIPVLMEAFASLFCVISRRRFAVMFARFDSIVMYIMVISHFLSMDPVESAPETGPSVPLKTALTEWAKNTEGIGSIAALAMVVDVPTESFRVALSRNRFSEAILQKLVDLGFAASRKELSENYAFTVLSRMVRRRQWSPDVRTELVACILQGEDPKDADILRTVLRDVRTEVLGQICACKLTHRVSGYPGHAGRRGESTAIAVFPVDEDLDGGPDIAQTIRNVQQVERVVAGALMNGVPVDCHNLLDSPRTDVAVQRMSALIAEFTGALAKTLRAPAPETQMRWFGHFAKPGPIGPLSHYWIHLHRSGDVEGWAVYDHIDLQQVRFSGTAAPWKYTSLVVSTIPREKWRDVLKRLGYALSYERGLAFQPEEDKGQCELVVDAAQ